MKKTLILLLALIIIISCEKSEKIQPVYNAEVLSYEAKKAYCLYGWTIKIGNDTILSTSDILIEEAGFDVEKSVKLNIEIISRENFCKYLYCEIKLIETNNLY